MGPRSPEQLVCQSPAYPFANRVESAQGNLTVLLDGSPGRRAFRMHYYPPPQILPFEHDDDTYHLKSGDHEIEIHVRRGLGEAGNPGRGGTEGTRPALHWWAGGQNNARENWGAER